MEWDIERSFGTNRFLAGALMFMTPIQQLGLEEASPARSSLCTFLNWDQTDNSFGAFFQHPFGVNTWERQDISKAAKKHARAMGSFIGSLHDYYAGDSAFSSYFKLRLTGPTKDSETAHH